MTRFAVLVSGGGTNLQAILDFWSNPPAAYPTGSAVPAGVAAEVVDHKAYPSRAAFEEALVAVLDRLGVEWLVLAGFMRVLTPPFVRRYAGRILNTHPALLPSFPGKDGASQAVAAGVKVSGCTVHFVDEGVDTGPIIAQAVVPVLETDSPDDLGERIKRVEHRIYPKVIAKVLAGRYRVEGRVVHLDEGGP